MSVKKWAIKPGELKPLSRSSLLIWAARNAMRTEAWRPPGVKSSWDAALRLLVARAFDDADRAKVKPLARDLGDRGADACNRRDGKPTEALGQCMNYATQTLGCALAATLLPDGPALAKALIDVAKYAGSIPAVLAHAGLVRAPKGNDPVDVAALAMWSAMRTDLAACAAITAPLSASRARTLAPLWPPGALAWVRT
jgi:hypothetical protein